jgi:hypothetical protein
MNFEWNKVNKVDLVDDLVKVATFNVVAHVLMNVRYGEPLFNERFVYFTLFVLTGFAVHHIFLRRRAQALGASL